MPSVPAAPGAPVSLVDDVVRAGDGPPHSPNLLAAEFFGHKEGIELRKALFEVPPLPSIPPAGIDEGISC